MLKQITGFLFTIALVASTKTFAQQPPQLNTELADKLAHLPLHCINQEFPNKTSHVANSDTDAVLLPSQLHPSFYGCLDWHSSVHGHWMLIRLLKTFPDLKSKDEIIKTLSNSFQPEKMKAEAEYFSKYAVAETYERTYGWAWLLKMDEELATWNNTDAKKWHEAIQPLTQQILKLWNLYWQPMRQK